MDTENALGSAQSVGLEAELSEEKSAEPNPAEKKSQPATDTWEYSKYQWIDNYLDLQDEGVLFGLENDNPEEKVNTIRAYYAERCAVQKALVDGMKQKLEEAESELAEKTAELKVAEEYHLANPPTLPPRSPFLQPVLLLRLTVVVIMWIGLLLTAKLVLENSQYPALATNALAVWIVAVAVWAFGSFSLWRLLSLFFNNEIDPAASRIREWVVEHLPPLVCAALLGWCAQGMFGGDALPSFLLGVIFYLAFLFSSGKLLTGTVEQLMKQIALYKSEKKRLQDAEAKRKQALDQLADLRAAVEARVMRRDSTHAEWVKLAQQAVTLTRLYEAKAETAAKNFLSEFTTAKAARNRLSETVKERIRNSRRRNAGQN